MLNSSHCRGFISPKARANFCSARFAARLPLRGMLRDHVCSSEDTVEPLENHDSPQEDYLESSSFDEMDAVLAEMSRTRDLIRILEQCFVSAESRLSGVGALESRKELPAEGEI